MQYISIQHRLWMGRPIFVWKMFYWHVCVHECADASPWEWDDTQLVPRMWFRWVPRKARGLEDESSTCSDALRLFSTPRYEWMGQSMLCKSGTHPPVALFSWRVRGVCVCTWMCNCEIFRAILRASIVACRRFTLLAHQLAATRKFWYIDILTIPMKTCWD